jgi:hypothetical protein
MEDLRRLFIEDGRQEMLLPLKSEMDNYHVFPKVALLDQSGKNHNLSDYNCTITLPVLRITDIGCRICERDAAHRDHGARE